MSKPPVKKPEEIGTTGHEWDGIKELNNPLPRWWLWTLYVTIIWGIGYTIAYPAWPLIHEATPGLLGYSTRGEVAADIKKVNDANAAIEAKLAVADLKTITDDPTLDTFASNAGASVFRTNCSQCHGDGAAGAKGYPNLLDDSWLWGGDIESIVTTIRYGIRNDHDETRYSEMPAFGDILSKEEITEVVNYVLLLAGEDYDAKQAAPGELVYTDNCAACHGETGEGDKELGAPNLTDAIWLYGGDYDTISETVTNSRFGVMPAWGDRLTDAQVNAVSVYVHQLGGGEKPD